MPNKEIFKFYVSYNDEDKELVEKLATGLMNEDISLVYAENLIEAGADWQDSVTKGMATVDGIIVLLTPKSISSSYVMNELGMGRALAHQPNKSKLFLPVIYDHVEVPAFIKDI